MLQIVKEYIEDLPEEDFKDFYQKYVVNLQDEIINRDVQRASKLYNRIEDMAPLVSCLNILTEELNRL